MKKVILKKVCVSDDGKMSCEHQGTEICKHCGIYAGQRFRTPEKRKILFSGKPISTLLKRLLFGG